MGEQTDGKAKKDTIKSLVGGLRLRSHLHSQAPTQSRAKAVPPSTPLLLVWVYFRHAHSQVDPPRHAWSFVRTATLWSWTDWLGRPSISQPFLSGEAQAKGSLGSPLRKDEQGCDGGPSAFS